MTPAVQSSMRNPAGHIRSLDTLRGLAALAVATYHAREAVGHPGLVPHAYLCVDLFFVLSGCVLDHRYGRELREGYGVGAFMRVRIARLYPLYLVATLACIGWTVLALRSHGALRAQGPHVLGAAAFNLALAPVPPGLAFRPEQPLFPFLAQAWSILWEVTLSGVFAVWMRGGGGLGWIAAAAFALLVVGTWGGGSIDYGWTMDRAWVGGVRALLGFALGVACRRVFVAVSARGDRRLRLSLIAGGLAAGAAGLDYVLLDPVANRMVELLCVAALFPLLVCAVALADHGLLANRVGDLIGGASYSIYLLHTLVIAAMAAVAKRVLQHHPIAHADLWLALAIVAALLPLSWASWRGLERPAQRWMLRRPPGAITPPPLSAVAPGA